jgi:cytochrome c oxidase assembly factor CtaG
VVLAGLDASWTFDPVPIVLIAVAAWLYGRRWRVARAGADQHRSHRGLTIARARDAPAWRAACFGAALVALVAALISPIDRLGEQVLTMHMTQHLLLLDVAPILAILGFTRVILRPATRRVQAVERAAGPLAHPVFAALLYVATMAAWHVPALYDAALEHAGVHVLEHVCFAVAGGLYWWHLLSPIRGRHRLTGMGPVVYMVATKLGVGLIGIVITLAPNSIYDFYSHQGDVWGMDPHTDQQVAGALMAIEQSIVMGTALAWLFIRMLGESQRSDERAERYEPAA